MRHEHHLLTLAESQKVIDAVDAWIARTGCNYLKLMTAAGVNPSTRCLVRRGRRRLTTMTAARIRAAIKAHPKGISRADHKLAVAAAMQGRVDREKAKRASEPRPEHVDSNVECPLCGTLRRDGCSHWPKMPSSSEPRARHYHAGLLSAGWSSVGNIYRKTGRIAVQGAGVLKVVCEIAPELLDFVPDPLARAEAEYAERAAELSATAYFECHHRL